MHSFAFNCVCVLFNSFALHLLLTACTLCAHARVSSHICVSAPIYACSARVAPRHSSSGRDAASGNERGAPPAEWRAQRRVPMGPAPMRERGAQTLPSAPPHFEGKGAEASQWPQAQGGKGGPKRQVGRGRVLLIRHCQAVRTMRSLRILRVPQCARGV